MKTLHARQGEGRPVSRRRFLLSALCGVLGAHALAGCVRKTDDSTHWLQQLAGERDAVLRLGAAYLRLFPDEARPGLILGLLERDIAEQMPGGMPPPGDHPRVVETMHALVRREYRTGGIVDVDGWQLSRSEARVYAAVALLAP